MIFCCIISGDQGFTMYLAPHNIKCTWGLLQGQGAVTGAGGKTLLSHMCVCPSVCQALCVWKLVLPTAAGPHHCPARVRSHTLFRLCTDNAGMREVATAGCISCRVVQLNIVQRCKLISACGPFTALRGGVHSLGAAGRTLDYFLEVAWHLAAHQFGVLHACKCCLYTDRSV